MNILKQYQPLVKYNARRLAQYYGVERDDLEQEGNLMLWKIQEAGDLGDNTNAVSTYIKLRVVGAMQDYIAKNVGPVAVPKSAFWEQGERANVGGFGEIGDSINSDDPETLYLKEESDEDFSEKVIALIDDLTFQEIVVFEKRFLTDEPMSSRELAAGIGVKSPQTVLNIETRIIKKAKEIF